MILPFSPFNMICLVAQKNVVLSKCCILHNMIFGLKCHTYEDFQSNDLF